MQERLRRYRCENVLWAGHRICVAPRPRRALNVELIALGETDFSEAEVHGDAGWLDSTSPEAPCSSPAAVLAPKWLLKRASRSSGIEV